MNQRARPQASDLSFGVNVRVLLVGLVLLCAGCAEPGVMVQRPSPVEDEAVLQDYVGLSESQARDLARGSETPFRVVTRDGVSLTLTCDLLRGRIDADGRDGVVVAYAVEGTKQRTKKDPAVKTPN